MNKKLAVTIGDPSGIGAETVIKAIKKLDLKSDEIVIIGNSEVLESYGADKDFLAKYDIAEISYDMNLHKPAQVTPEAGEFAYRTIIEACRLAKERKIKGIVTAPTSKEAMILAGHNYSGQTEVLEKELAETGQQAQMLFCSSLFNVLLLTRHIPLKDVGANITKENLIRNVISLKETFKKHFGIENPSFGLCGVNPHAGENGILGKEEKGIFAPAVKVLRQKGIKITDAQPADALFAKIGNKILNNQKAEYDCIICPYHDQGLIPVKMFAGKKAVNTTIGLNIIRTSPAHGTAFDIAGKGIADESGMIEAIKFFDKIM